MKLALVYLAVFAVVCVSARPDRKYTTKYDNIDVEQILHSDRLLNNYVKCLLDKGPCTIEGTELKKTLPDALETGCEKCSPRQRELAEKSIKYLSENKREVWQQLLDKYDPDKVYRIKWQERANEAKIKL